MAPEFEPPQELSVDGEDYAFVKTRTYDPISVYRGADSFLRIGPQDKLEKEATFHQQLLTLGFPVPQIVRTGNYQGQYYYVEKSFGDNRLGDSFSNEYSAAGEVCDQSFNAFLELMESYTQAQLKTAKELDWSNDFHDMTQLNILAEERPDLKEQLEAAYERVKTRLAHIPAVLTHADFNPFNLFKEGIIDIGDFSYAPAGYDVSTNVFHTYMFPSGGDFEMHRRYSFKPAQLESYFAHIDQLFSRQGLPNPSVHVDDYLIGKMTWSAARMHKKPKVQAYRYELLDRITKAYLDGQDVKDILLTA